MKTKKNRVLKKTRGGIPGRPVVSLALICHGGNQLTDKRGNKRYLNEFTVPDNVVINFFVPKNTTSFARIETPIDICNNVIPKYDSYDSGQLCPNYKLNTLEGEVGGIYECSKISLERIKHKYVIHKGIRLNTLVKKLKDIHHNIILNCYFCRANEENNRTIAREDPLMSISVDVADLPTNWFESPLPLPSPPTKKAKHIDFFENLNFDD